MIGGTRVAPSAVSGTTGSGTLSRGLTSSISRPPIRQQFPQRLRISSTAGADDGEPLNTGTVMDDESLSFSPCQFTRFAQNPGCFVCDDDGLIIPKPY